MKNRMSLIVFYCFMTINLLVTQSISVFAEGENSNNQTRIVSDKKEKFKHYIIQLKDNKTPEDLNKLRGLNKELNMKKLRGLNAYSTQLSDSQYKVLLNSPDVLYININGAVSTQEANTNIESNASKTNILNKSELLPWGIRAIGGEYFLEKDNINGDGVKIAILDTGISQHKNLEIAGGISFVSDSKDYYDDNGHGTHIAGIIAANKNSSGKVSGVASQADIYSVKVLNKNGIGSYSEVIEGIYWSIENKMDVISISFGGAQESEILHNAIKAAVKKGILIVAAAGNMGYGEEREVYPARYPEAISVGAISETYDRADFSSTGSGIDIVAPGTNIISTSNNEDYVTSSGTSVAVPYVTGTLALLLSHYENIKAEDIKNILYSSATPLGEQNLYGNGVVNTAKALGLINHEIETSGKAIGNRGSYELVEPEITALKTKLQSIIFNAKKKEDTILAKEIESTFLGLLSEEEELRKSLVVTGSSNINNNSMTKSHAKFSNNVAYQELKKHYSETIESYSDIFADDFTNIAHSVTSDVYFQDSVTRSVYNKSSVIAAGEKVVVSSFQNIARKKINITVTSRSYQVVASETLYNIPANQEVVYSWQTTTETYPGEYTIRFYYPEEDESDFYSINISQSAIGPDTFENNDTNESATETEFGATYYSFISHEFDEDTYKIFTGPHSGILEVSLDVPDSINYDIQIGDQNNHMIGFSYSDRDDNLKIHVDPNKYYFIRIFDIEGGYGLPYSLRIGKVIPNPQYIEEDSPQDTSLTSEEYRVFAFTPVRNGKYTISTSPFGGSADTNDTTDTIIELYGYYDNGNLTNQLGENDDSNNTLFSKMDVDLYLGVTYYIKLKPNNYGTINTRLTVAPFRVPSEPINLDEPIDISVTNGEFKVFRFTPTVSGAYSFETSPFGGLNENSDTYLRLFYDSELTNTIAVNDDYGGSLFSKIEYELVAGTTYYLRYSGYSDRASRARIDIKNIYKNVDVYIQAHGETSSTFAGQWARVYDNVNSYINLVPSPQIRNEMIEDGFVKNEDGIEWYFIDKLSHYFDVSFDGQKVEILSDNFGDVMTSNTLSGNMFIRLDKVNGLEQRGSATQHVTGVMVKYSYIVDGKVTITVTGETLVGTSLAPSTWDVKIRLLKSNSRDKLFRILYPVETKKESLIWGNPMKYEYEINETAFYESDIDVEINVPGWGELNDKELDYNTPMFLSNRVGELYWDYTDSWSGIDLEVPMRADWKKETNISCGLNDTTRKEYRTWYDNKYGPIPGGWTFENPETGKIDWNYEIHHMRPCEFGGDNNNDNLIPLPKAFHRSYISPWWTKYAPQ